MNNTDAQRSSWSALEREQSWLVSFSGGGISADFVTFMPANL